jgi:hypothetical protein
MGAARLIVQCFHFVLGKISLFLSTQLIISINVASEGASQRLSYGLADLPRP